jgi:nucleoside 2-deoxyribosyltransferase
MLCVYVAGPYTGDNAMEIEQNVRRAEDVALQIARIGHSAVCPHTQSRYFFGQLTEEYWLEATMEQMRRCDMVVLVDGWQYSRGTIGEILEAFKLGIPVYRSLVKLEDDQPLLEADHCIIIAQDRFGP